MPTAVSTAVGSSFTDLTTFLTGTVAVAVLALAMAGIGLAFGIKWLRKGANKA